MTRKIAIVSPSLKAGGMERVASTLANYLAGNEAVQVTLFTLVKMPIFFEIHPKVQLVEPPHEGEMSFLKQAIKSIRYLRKELKNRRPEAVLTFGDRYNSLVVLAAMGTSIPVFVCNRQNPYLSNGKMVDILNWMLYRFAGGMVAQTSIAKRIFERKYHRNVRVIGNPFHLPEKRADLTAKAILYVGRYSDQKNQFELIQLFDRCETGNWELNLLGDGPKKDQTEAQWLKSPKKEAIHLLGFSKDVAAHYCNNSIFGFTSRTEGFPNALGEAMTYGMAVVSYDCIAGPADLIDDGVNGFLVPVGDHDLFAKRLQQLIDDESLRMRLGNAAREKMRTFHIDHIAAQYLQFMIPDYETGH